MNSLSQETINYAAYAVFNIMLAREVNNIVTEPYMDEPFHIPQAQAYCDGHWDVWDSKITTPPGLYIFSVILKRIFLFRCTTGILRLTNVLFLLTLPPIISHLLATIRRVNPPRAIHEPTLESLVISTFPVAWFFAFLYYTELGSLALVLGMVLAAVKGRHWTAALLGLISCTFRQTNIIWALYALGFSLLFHIHRRSSMSSTPETTGIKRALYDPPAETATFFDVFRTIWTLPRVIPDVLPILPPYILLAFSFASFVAWNGGIVLGDKSNHIPQLHIPQMYYFLGFTTFMGFPVLITRRGGPIRLIRDVSDRMFGGVKQVVWTILFTTLIAISVHFFTIHHPFLLSDNRHYTFYLWARVYRRHPLVAYLLSPVYLALYWAWFIRIYSPPSSSNPTLNQNQVEVKIQEDRKTLLQSLLLPICLIPTLLPTPLLEPRYFLIPYFLIRLEIPVERGRVKIPWALVVEGLWYAVINWATMSVFLYREREGVGRFMW